MKSLNFRKVYLIASVMLGLFVALNASFAQKNIELIGGTGCKCGYWSECNKADCELVATIYYFGCKTPGAEPGDTCTVDASKHPCGSANLNCYGKPGAPSSGVNLCDET